MKFVNEAVNELKKLGIIEFLDEKPHCFSPLTVSIKIDSHCTSKRRLRWDGSRCVNLCIKKQKVTLSHLQRALEIKKEERRRNFQIKYALKAAYHHIRIHSSQTKYLGAALEKTDGGIQYFVFLFLPFGLSSAVHCITKLFKPINAFIHGRGIRRFIYFDDGRIFAETKRKIEEHLIVVYDVLDKSGWILEVQKSDGEEDASQSKEYLRFIIGTVSMTVHLVEGKKQRTLQGTRKTIAYGTRSILARELAVTVGKIIALEPALEPVVIMAVRASYIDLDEATERRGWGILSRTALNSIMHRSGWRQRNIRLVYYWPS